MSKEQSIKTLPFVEFIALMALMISLVAMSIDVMLPAIPNIGSDLGMQHANDGQLILTWLFAGLAVGGLFYGPVSDSIGRKPTIYVGFALFIIGCILSIVATSYSMMLFARFLQGLGVAGPRGIALAIVRDQFSGDMMARVMSFIMSTFVLIPIIAPAIGQGILLFAGWQAIFGFLLLMAVVVLIWFSIRQPESLVVEKRIPFSMKRILRGFREVLSNRIALGFTIASGLVSGAFLGYLNSAQPVFQEQYGLGTNFPLVFATIAIASGFAFFMNAKLVMRYGMRRLTSGANTSLAVISVLYFICVLMLQGHPPLWTLIAYFMANFFAVGIMFGNFNSLAMEPLGHIAGVGSAVVSSLANFISIPIGAWIGGNFNDTVIPLIGGFATLCLLTIFVMWWADSGKQQLVTTESFN